MVPEGERRLEYRLSDGWAPLCQFLGCDVPQDTPFPRVNEGTELVEMMVYLKAEAWKRVRWTIFQFLVRLVIIAVIALGPLLFLPTILFGNPGKKDEL